MSLLFSREPKELNTTMKSFMVFSNLFEYNRATTVKNAPKLQSVLDTANLKEEEFFDKLETIKDKSAIQWFVKWFVNGSPLEDLLSRGVDGFEKFNKLKNKNLLKPEHKDIGKLKNLDEFENLLDQYDLPEDISTDKGLSEEVYKDEDVRILVVKDEKAACYYGQGTKWCTAAKNNNMFNTYDGLGPLYVLLPLKPEHKDEKYQISFDADQYMNEKDKSAKVTIKKRFKKALPFLNQLFLKSNGTKWSQNWLKSDEHIKGGERAEIAIDEHDRKDLIHLSAHHAYNYAKDVVEGRWPEGEKAIAANANCAYNYAKNIIKGRWPEGEKAIAANPSYAYMYAADVIKGRWPEGEKALATNSDYAYYTYHYAKDVVKGRWPEGEKVITKSKYADQYKDVVKGDSL